MRGKRQLLIVGKNVFTMPCTIAAYFYVGKKSTLSPYFVQNGNFSEIRNQRQTTLEPPVLSTVSLIALVIFWNDLLKKSPKRQKHENTKTCNF